VASVIFTDGVKGEPYAVVAQAASRGLVVGARGCAEFLIGLRISALGASSSRSPVGETGSDIGSVHSQSVTKGAVCDALDGVEPGDVPGDGGVCKVEHAEDEPERRTSSQLRWQG
jgi:hypothetical protein